MSFESQITAGTYARLMMTQLLARWWVVPVLPVLCCAVLGVADLRWLIVALMVLFIMVPMGMSLCYFNYMLTRQVRWSVLRKTVEVGAQGLRLVFAAESPVLVPWSDVKSVRTSSGVVMLELAQGSYQYLMIPAADIGSRADREAFAQLLKKYYFCDK